MSWQAINNAASVISFISFIPIIWSLVLIIRTDRNRNRNMKVNRKFEAREKAAVLIVDVGPENKAMRESVEQWIYAQEELKNFPAGNIYHIPFRKRIGESDAEALIKDIRKKKAEMIGKGAQKIHLFYRGPAILAMMIGAEFKNGRPGIVLYHNDVTNPKGYVNWGPLER